MKTDFRQLVDRDLSGLRWDEARQARVLASLEPKGGTSVKRKMTMSLAFALVLMMMASVALAAVVLNYSPAVSAKKLAVQTMCDTYGFDRDTLGLFKVDVKENDQCTHVYFLPNEFLPVERIGEYDVHIADGKAEVRWTHGGTDSAIWQSGDPNAAVWGAKQLAAYLAAGPNERGDWLEPYMTTATVLPMATPETMVSPDTQPKTGDLPLAQAMAFADAALMDVYGMTEAEVAGLDHDVYASVIVENDRRVWDITYGDSEGTYSVHLDAETGEILDIGMSTGGNG